jgi:hypothetical protein
MAPQIYVTQNYWDQGKGAKPNTTSPNNTHIADFTFRNFVGVINECVVRACAGYHTAALPHHS